MVGLAARATKRDYPVPGILKLHPGVRIRTPDLRSCIVGIAIGQEPGEDQNTNGDKRTSLHHIPTQVIGIT